MRELFHADGRRRELTHEHADLVDWTHRWLYDLDNRLSEETLDGTFPFRRTFKYDKSGRLETVFHHENQGRWLEESYLHHKDGTSTQISYPQDHRQHRGESSTLFDSLLHISADAVRIVTMRDSREKPLEKVLYDIDDRTIHRVLFLYDDAGRLVEEGEAYSDNTIRDDFKNLYRYDAHGRCIEKEVRTPFCGERQTTTYNESGDVSTFKTTPLDIGIDIGPKRPWALHYGYEYDVRGNWLVCDVETRTLDTAETTDIRENRRRLTYWD